MTEQELKTLACEISSVSVFRKVLETNTMGCLLRFLCSSGSVQERLFLFGEFVFSLSDDNYSFSDFLCRVVYTDENRFIIDAAQNAEIPAALKNNTENELMLFTKLTKLQAEDFCASLGYGGNIPQFENTCVDFKSTYSERVAYVSSYGYGIFASAGMFRVSGEEIIPVYAADVTSADKFVGYEEERKKVFDNTQALVDGRPAANVLLFGDAGTGKSSTVKACANHFAKQGVRLIELRKDQLFSLSAIMEKICCNPLKFIIFIDDLSFNKNDDCFSMLKAALEGSATASASNAVIYATSNRRHIIKETFRDRSDDDIHRNDTIQELMSLSDRFGLTVYFEKPSQKLYLDIIHELAARKGLVIEQKELDTKAEAFALTKGSRSPRAAEQFIDSLL